MDFYFEEFIMSYADESNPFQQHFCANQIFEINFHGVGDPKPQVPVLSSFMQPISTQIDPNIINSESTSTSNVNTQIAQPEYIHERNNSVNEQQIPERSNIEVSKKSKTKKQSSSSIEESAKRRKFSMKEDLLLTKLFNKFGTNWAKISTYFIDRSAVMIKNRFYSYLNKNEKLVHVNRVLEEVEKQGDLNDFKEESLESLRDKVCERKQKPTFEVNQRLSAIKNTQFVDNTFFDFQEKIMTLEEQLNYATAEIAKLRKTL